ncbi:MAG: aspartyl-phosphate phosphatase Spo0E family protein [Bacillota bacterium]
MIERKRLESMAEKFGLLHPNVIRQSKKLDKLINQIQQRLAS